MSRVPAAPPLDPECAAVLAQLPRFPPLTLASIPEMRRPLPGFEPPTDAALSRGGFFDVSRLAVPGPDGAPDVPVVVCRPVVAEGLRPVVYQVHGGGMVSGSPEKSLPRVLDLAEDVGAVVVSVDYRLAPETPHPGPVEDCCAALSWVHQHGRDIGADPARIVVAGDSAGGGLAASMVLLSRDRGGPRPIGQLLVSPMLDDRNDRPSVLQMEGVDTWDRPRNEVGWTALLGPARGGPDVPASAAASRADDLGDLPPAFLEVGSAETFRDEVVDFASRIWLAGGAAELHVWPGGFHGFDVLAPAAAISRQARAARRSWLRRLLTD